MKLSKHFSIEEFEKSSRGMGLGINNKVPREYMFSITQLAHTLELIRYQCNAKFPPKGDKRRLFILSGYRSPELNSVIGGAKNSQHMYGEAVDIICEGLTAEQLFNVIRDLDLFCVNQCILEFSNWVHFAIFNMYDTRPVKKEYLIATKDAKGLTVYSSV